MWVWESMRPGRTVAFERSMRCAPEGTGAEASATFSIFSPRMKMSWSLRGAELVPSMSVPARITVTEARSGSGDWAGAAILAGMDLVMRPPGSGAREAEQGLGFGERL